ncbi:MAG: hypothetical protein ACJ8AO_12315 [Gemmatimonadaceae bacterium]
MTNTLLHRLRLPLALAGLALAACGGRAPSTDGAPAQQVEVGVQPPTARVEPGASVEFQAAVTGTVDTSVTWQVVEAAGGSVDAAGLYTAPAAGGTFHVRASSRAAPTAQATATVSVVAPPPPVTVVVAPASASVLACRTQRFTAAVSGTTNGAVTWSVQEGAAGGTVDASGLYTAPSAAGTYHLVATSAAAPASMATVPVTVTESVLSVAVTPQTLTLAPGGTGQFTATVTTTCGSFASVRTVTAPLAN